MNTVAQHTDYSLMLGLFSAVADSLRHAGNVVRGENFVENAPQGATCTTVAKNKGLLTHL